MCTCGCIAGVVESTSRSQQMQKHKFGVTCPNAPFIESIPVPTEHEKECVDVSLTGMHYMTCRSHRMHKHKFTITCPDTLFVKSVPVPPEHEK
jgi:hypothetical protein